MLGHARAPYRGAVMTPAPDRSSAPDAAPRVTLLVAHGSRNPAAAEAHERLVRDVAAAAGADVRPAYLEMSEPSIPAAIDAAAADGAQRVQVLPCFLHPGNHVLVDIPALVDAARRRHPGVEMELLDHLGADTGLIQLLAQRVEDR